MEDRLTSVRCVICGKPVRLDECKVTDLLEAGHEECIAERIKEGRLKEEIKKRKTTLERWQQGNTMTCWICDKALAFEERKSDDRGRARARRLIHHHSSRRNAHNFCSYYDGSLEK